jgi:hypothetical protein
VRGLEAALQQGKNNPRGLVPIVVWHWARKGCRIDIEWLRLVDFGDWFVVDHEGTLQGHPDPSLRKGQVMPEYGACARNGGRWQR